MKRDPLDEWLQESNPVSNGEHAAVEPSAVPAEVSASVPAVASNVELWTHLRDEQRRRRAWLRYALAASVLFVVGGVAVALNWKPERLQDNVVAEIQPHERVDRDRPTRTVEKSSGGMNRSEGGEDVRESDIQVSPSQSKLLTSSATSVAQREAERELAEFGQFVQDAGPYLGKRWNMVAEQLTNMPAKTQRDVVDWVPRLETSSQRHRAMMLVCQAARDSQRGLLVHWLQTPSLKEEAWSRLLNSSSLEQLGELSSLATTHMQRHQLCRQVALSTQSNQTRGKATEMLVSFAMQPAWRRASGMATKSMSRDSIHKLVLDLRYRDSRTRTAIGYLLASVPGKEIDEHLSSMVLQGRYRQPAYLALLSRNTPDANAFLKHALTQPTLTPAFHSARTHFSSIEPELRQWIQQTRGTFNEQTDINRTLFDRTLLASTKPNLQQDRHRLIVFGEHGDSVRCPVNKQRIGSS